MVVIAREDPEGKVGSEIKAVEDSDVLDAPGSQHMKPAAKEVEKLQSIQQKSMHRRERDNDVSQLSAKDGKPQREVR